MNQLLPVRMLLQHVYCKRLFYLEWIDGEFAHNKYTVEGTFVHRNVDTTGEKTTWEKTMEKKTSVSLSCETERITGKIDLIETTDGFVQPVEIKRGVLPDRGPWFDHMIQVTAYAMLLRSAGKEVKEGILYYAASKKRAVIEITEGRINITRKCIKEAFETAACSISPEPLQDSKKCENCSLNNICMPDEYWAIKDNKESGRRIISARDDGIPLYVQDQGAHISRTQNRLKVFLGKQSLGEILLHETSQVCIMGNIQITTQAVHACMNNDIPILHFTSGGYFLGVSQPLSTKSARVRIHQAEISQKEDEKLNIAKEIVEAKIRNQRTILKRNARNLDEQVIKDMASLAARVKNADNFQALLGFEGAAAKLYFQNFNRMLKTKNTYTFDLKTRNRRPPKDPINAMLSYAYGMLVKDCTVALAAAGFEPCLGIYHQQRPGRPALALDLMEPFRSILADSAVIYAINNNMVKPRDFVIGIGSVTMKPEARKAVIQSYEKRMEQLITHPVFDYRISYRRVLEVEARLLSRHIAGELDAYSCFTTR